MRALNWLSEATELIRFKPDKLAVWDELSDHIQCRQEAIQRDFPELTPEEAEERAVAAMGDPEPVARELASLHKPWLGYIWRVSQALAALAAAALIVGMPLYHLTVDREGLLSHIAYLATWEADEHYPKLGISPMETTPLRVKDTARPGGYAVFVRRADLKSWRADGGGRMQTIDMELWIYCGLRGEAMSLYDAIVRVTDSLGNVYEQGVNDPGWYISSSVQWGDMAPLGQRVALTLLSVPEDAEWVELTFGRGELADTLRVELTGEARA